MRKIVIVTGLVLAVLLLTATFSIPGTHAQQQQCFTQTGHCISGRIAQYWNQIRRKSLKAFSPQRHKEHKDPNM